MRYDNSSYLCVLCLKVIHGIPSVHFFHTKLRTCHSNLQSSHLPQPKTAITPTIGIVSTCNYYCTVCVITLDHHHNGYISLTCTSHHMYIGVVWDTNCTQSKCQRMTNAVKTTFNIIIVCTYVQYVKYKQCFISFLHELQQCSIYVAMYTSSNYTAGYDIR